MKESWERDGIGLKRIMNRQPKRPETTELEIEIKKKEELNTLVMRQLEFTARRSGIE